jgi:hypothetical protein
MSGQFYALAVSLPGLEPPTHWIGGWVDPRAGLDAVETRKKSHRCPCSRPTCSKVSILTELSRLSGIHSCNILALSVVSGHLVTLLTPQVIGSQIRCFRTRVERNPPHEGLTIALTTWTQIDAHNPRCKKSQSHPPSRLVLPLNEVGFQRPEGSC